MSAEMLNVGLWSQRSRLLR